MATDLTAWLDEREREARTAMLLPSNFECSVSPDTALRVLRALRAAKNRLLMGHSEACDVGHCQCDCGHDELQAALDALPGAKP